MLQFEVLTEKPSDFQKPSFYKDGSDCQRSRLLLCARRRRSGPQPLTLRINARDLRAKSRPYGRLRSETLAAARSCGRAVHRCCSPIALRHLRAKSRPIGRLRSEMLRCGSRSWTAAYSSNCAVRKVCKQFDELNPAQVRTCAGLVLPE